MGLFFFFFSLKCVCFSANNMYLIFFSCNLGLPNSIKDEDEKLKSMISWEKKSAAKSKGNGRGEISFPPFAMATYKLFGRLWINPEISDKERIAGYLSAASTWLKKLEFQHNDFNFFMSRRF